MGRRRAKANRPHSTDAAARRPDLSLRPSNHNRKQQHMPGVAVATNKGQPKSLTDALYVSFAPECPFTSRLRKGKAIDQLFHTYKVKKKRNPVRSGASDGQPVTVSSGKNDEEEVVARVGVFKTSPRVGDLAKHNGTVGRTTAEENGKNPGTGATHMAQAVADHLQAIKYGEEIEALSDQESKPDQGPNNGSKFRGAGKWINNSAQTDQPVPEAVRTPSNQIYAGTLANLNEEAFDDLMALRFTANGTATELFGVFAPALKKAMNLFTKRVPAVANFDTVIRYGPGKETKTVTRGVDFFDTSWGMAEFHPDIFLPTDQRGYLFDMKHVEMMPYGPGIEEEDLGNDGGGEAKVLRAMFTWHPGDPRAHLGIKPSTETVVDQG